MAARRRRDIAAGTASADSAAAETQPAAPTPAVVEARGRVPKTWLGGRLAVWLAVFVRLRLPSSNQHTSGLLATLLPARLPFSRAWRAYMMRGLEASGQSRLPMTLQRLQGQGHPSCVREESCTEGRLPKSKPANAREPLRGRSHAAGSAAARSPGWLARCLADLADLADLAAWLTWLTWLPGCLAAWLPGCLAAWLTLLFGCIC